jgi:hypothetical protein
MSTLSVIRRSGGHVVLGTRFHWEREPRHVLEVPPNWAAAWDGDFSIDDEDDLTMPREAALQLAAERNAERMANAGDGLPVGWWLAFAIGPLCSTSFVMVEHGANATFNLDSSLAVVFPTDAEIAAILEPQPAKAKRRKAVRHEA